MGAYITFFATSNLCTLPFFRHMEAFHLLSRGGAQFNKKRFGKDVQLFNVSSHLIGRTNNLCTSSSVFYRSRKSRM